MLQHPLVSPWMLNEGHAVRATGERLREMAQLLGGIEVTVGNTLGATATALGWEGQITARADEAAVTTRTMLARLAECCDAAGTTLLELAGGMSWHGPQLVQLLQDGTGGGVPRFGFGVPGEPPTFSPDPQHPVIGLPVQPIESVGDSGGGDVGSLTADRASQPGLPVEPGMGVLPIDQRERLIQQHRDDLDMYDQRCHDRLQLIRGDIEALFPRGTDPEFLRSLVPSDVWKRLIEAGIVQPITPIQRPPRTLPIIGPPIYRTLPVRPELRPRCIRIVRPPRDILPIRGEGQPIGARPPVEGRIGPIRHTLPIREAKVRLGGAEVSRGPGLTVQGTVDR